MSRFALTPLKLAEGARQQAGDLLEISLIDVVKCCGLARIEVQHRQKRPIVVDDGHDDFRSARGVTSDVTFEGMNIFHDLSFQSESGGATNSLSKRDLETADGSLIGTDTKEFRGHDAIETNPAHPREVGLENGSGGSHGCNGVIEPIQEASNLGARSLVALDFFDRHSLEIVTLG